MSYDESVVSAVVGDVRWFGVPEKSRNFENVTQTLRKPNSMDQKTIHLKHLYDLTHGVPDTPELSGVYTQKLVKAVAKQGNSLPQQVCDGKFCSHCQCLFIAGVNMSMRVVYKKSKSKSKTKKLGKERGWKVDKTDETKVFRERSLRLTCFTCNKNTNLPILNPKPKLEVQKETFVAKWEPQKSTAKDRAKKRKRNNLASLLSSKKEADSKGKSGLLSLDDFMR